MPEFMMLMKGAGGNGDWQRYIVNLQKTGMFRGGSMLGNGKCLSRDNAGHPCSVSGFMRFEAECIDDVTALVAGNPVYEAGGDIEILEIVKG